MPDCSPRVPTMANYGEIWASWEEEMVVRRWHSRWTDWWNKGKEESYEGADSRPQGTLKEETNGINVNASAHQENQGEFLHAIIWINAVVCQMMLGCFAVGAWGGGGGGGGDLVVAVNDPHRRAAANGLSMSGTCLSKLTHPRSPVNSQHRHVMFEHPSAWTGTCFCYRFTRNATIVVQHILKKKTLSEELRDSMECVVNIRLHLLLMCITGVFIWITPVSQKKKRKDDAFRWRKMRE